MLHVFRYLYDYVHTKNRNYSNKIYLKLKGSVKITNSVKNSI